MVIRSLSVQLAKSSFIATATAIRSLVCTLNERGHVILASGKTKPRLVILFLETDMGKFEFLSLDFHSWIFICLSAMCALSRPERLDEAYYRLAMGTSFLFSLDS